MRFRPLLGRMRGNTPLIPPPSIDRILNRPIFSFVRFVPITKPFAGHEPHLVKEQPERNPGDNIFRDFEVGSPITSEVEAEVVSLKNVR